MARYLQSVIAIFIIIVNCIDTIYGVGIIPDCPLPLPCECNGNQQIVYCSNKNLSSLPPIQKSEGKWTFYLDGNGIETIPENYFSGVSINFLSLENNAISTVGENAFLGSENTLNYFHLEYNKLRELPSAIAKLKQLTAISIQGNPIPDFPENVLRNLSSSLQLLSFGSESMTRWPMNMHLLPNLFSIDLYDVQFPELPDDAFALYKNNLIFLSFYNTGLTKLPSSLNDCRMISTMTFQGNKKLSANAITESITEGFPFLTSITFENNGLTTLPSIFSKSDKIRQIYVNNEPIEYLRGDIFPPDFSKYLYYLPFNGTRLTRIPPVLSNLDFLQALSITNSQIFEIQDNDCSRFFNLDVLFLSYNPLTQISENAFMNNKRLGDLVLDHTNLTSIPKALLKAESLQSVDMASSPVECTCASLGWMKSWKGIPSFYGDCVNLNGTSIMTYLKNEVPKCP
ncbi:leucine-rich repeat protein SHOC-2-like [Saccostrea echinata]|uniref:leucine-rich repeat protein SHOC-2-like n=1 Tax=Saccostrea echinata TaxID=191078 RepID=UPI002A80E5A6|nr:leucine-rich repeat protein SHOC-2-like [Saccostrea echinata]